MMFYTTTEDNHEPVTFADRVALLSIAREIGALVYPMKNFLSGKWASTKADRKLYLGRLSRDMRAIADKIDRVVEGE